MFDALRVSQLWSMIVTAMIILQNENVYTVIILITSLDKHVWDSNLVYVYL